MCSLTKFIKPGVFGNIIILRGLGHGDNEMCHFFEKKKTVQRRSCCSISCIRTGDYFFIDGRAENDAEDFFFPVGKMFFLSSHDQLPQE